VEPGMPYFSPAIIFKKPMKLEQDKTLALKYRIVVCNGEFKKDAVDALAKSFNQ